MREKVLSNQQVIAEVNRSFVPLWVNVKKTHLPKHLPAAQQIPEDDRKAVLGDQDWVARGFNRAFFAKSWVISPDGQRLLNPERRFGHEDTPQEFLQTLARAQQRMETDTGNGHAKLLTGETAESPERGL